MCGVTSSLQQATTPSLLVRTQHFNPKSRVLNGILVLPPGQRLFTASEPAPAPAPLRSQRGMARPAARPPLQAPAPRSGASRLAAATGPGPVPGRPAIVRLAAVRAPMPDGPATAQHAAENRSAAAATAPAATAANQTAAAATAPAAAATSATAGSSSTLFVVSAKSATVTQLGRGRCAPWPMLFSVLPYHVILRIDGSSCLRVLPSARQSGVMTCGECKPAYHISDQCAAILSAGKCWVFLSS